ncbi:MAG: polysaccharide deacetylase family protein [Erysipelotrichaceae bacterium]|nr:polysaccharide deacetylase family protein [Erysipelotrichaceae bacterium]
METKSSSASKGIRIVFAVLLLIFIGVSAYTIFAMYNKTRQFEFETIYNKDLIINEEKKLEEVTLKRDELLAEKEEIMNYGSSVKAYHDQFFEMAKEFENRVVNGQTDRKIAYLTFDDGPYRMSYKFLDILDEYDVPATFFYLKKCEEEGFRDEWIYDEVYKRVIGSGHTLGNHTASHQLGQGGIYSSVERFISEIEDNRKFIEDRYGYTTEVMRFPGGSPTAGSRYEPIVEELRKIHYAWVDWNSATGDGGRVLSPQEFRDNVLDNTNGIKLLVVLMHDYSDNTLIALPEIIEGLADQGYYFLPLFYDSQAMNR